MRGFLVPPLVLFCFACEPPLETPFRAPHAVAAITSSLPESWDIVAHEQDSIPWGHYNKGHGGEFLVVAGPEPVYFYWRDRDGQWQNEVLAREALELWVMPPSYRVSMGTYLDLHRPVPARLVAGSRSVRVYGLPTHHIVAGVRFEHLLAQATATTWSDGTSKQLSWQTWRSDIATAVELAHQHRASDG